MQHRLEETSGRKQFFVHHSITLLFLQLKEEMEHRDFDGPGKGRKGLLGSSNHGTPPTPTNLDVLAVILLHVIVLVSEPVFDFSRVISRATCSFESSRLQSHLLAKSNTVSSLFL